MLIESYFITTDVSAMQVFSKVVRAHQAWREEILSLCEEKGFASFLGPDFCAPDFFLKARTSQKVRFSSFNQVLDKHVYAGHDYEVYSLRRDYPPGADFYRQASDISLKHLSSVGLTPDSYGRPRHVGYQHAICLLLDIEHVHNTGDITAFSQIWRVLDRKNTPSLIVSVPAAIDPITTIYRVPDMPGIWSDISAQEVIDIFNHHNGKIKGLEV